MYFVFVEIGSKIIGGSESPSFVISGQSYDIWIEIIILINGDKKLGMRRKQVKKKGKLSDHWVLLALKENSGLKNSVGENKHLSLLFLFAIAPLFTWALQCSQHTYSNIAWQNSFAMSLGAKLSFLGNFWGVCVYLI